MGTTSSGKKIHIIGARRRSERERSGKLFEEIMTEKFPNRGRETDILVEEAQRIPNKMTPKRSHQAYPN